MLTRDDLHQLLNTIPDNELTAAATSLRPLVDPVLWSLLTAPIDAEPETEEERTAIAEADEDIRLGRLIAHEDIKREFGF